MRFSIPSRKDSPVTTGQPLQDVEKAEAVRGENAERWAGDAVGARDGDKEIEKRVVRKLDKRLVSLVFVLCTSPLLNTFIKALTIQDLLAYLDRSNIG